MLRGLYRFYLYLVYIGMLIFAVIGVQNLLHILLAKTILPSPYFSVTNADIVQAIVFTVVSWFIAALVGGLHYWLMRRDMRTDPTAGSGAMRSFFLNFVEFITLPLAVGLASSTIASLGSVYPGDTGFTASIAIILLALWTYLEWERRRIPADPGVALIFQHLHVYGAQLILLFILTFSWLGTVGQLVLYGVFGGRGANLPACGGFTACQNPNLLSATLSTLLIALFWLSYGFFNRNNAPSLLRTILYMLSFGYGITFVLTGIYRGFDLAFLSAYGIPVHPQDLAGGYAPYDVITPLTFGLLTASVYMLWLRSAVRQQTVKWASTTLTLQAILTALSSVAFWSGCGWLLLNLLEHLFPTATSVMSSDWAAALALLVTGLVYIPLDIHLRRRSEQTGDLPSLRGFTFVLLSEGIVAGAIGAAISLYSYGTALLGSPFSNWQYTAHTGISTFVIGVALIALYLWTSIHEGFFASHAPSAVFSQKPSEVVPPPLPNAQSIPAKVISEEETTRPLKLENERSIGDVLDALLAHSISRDEAIAQIEAIVKS